MSPLFIDTEVRVLVIDGGPLRLRITRRHSVHARSYKNQDYDFLLFK